MYRITQQNKIIGCTSLLCILFMYMLSAADLPLTNQAIKKAERLRFENPERAIQLLNKYYLVSIESRDTIKAINALTGLATVYGNQANYKGSYDKLWKALLLAEQANLAENKVYIYQRIGQFYSYYKRQQKSLVFLNKALALKKSLVDKGEETAASLSFSYSTISNCYRELGEIELAQLYIDTSFLYLQKEGVGKKLVYLELEQGFIYSQTEKYKEGIRLIEKHLPWFEKNAPAYRVLIFNYLGDAYLKDGNISKAERCFLTALATSKEYHSHINFAVLLHEKLATLYANQQQHEKAYEQLRKNHELERLFFDSRSENNRPLLEIQDAFREEMENKAQYLKEQRLAQLEHENEVSFLQNTIISVLLVSLLIFGILYFNYIRNKHKVEKQIIENKRELEIQKNKVLKKEQALEIQKNKELLSLKNKELATSALKLIEKEEFIQELKNRITSKKESVSLQEIKHLIKTATINNTNNWEEFEARFVAVNVGFYDRLKARFPKLTQGDRKLCALVKLKFTSKETARLLGLSVESVHTTRYRLRKKLGLVSGEDLTDFMDTI